MTNIGIKKNEERFRGGKYAGNYRESLGGVTFPLVKQQFLGLQLALQHYCNPRAVTLQPACSTTARRVAVKVGYGIAQALQLGCVTYSSKDGAGRPALEKMALIRFCSSGDVRYSPFWA